MDNLNKWCLEQSIFLFTGKLKNDMKEKCWVPILGISVFLLFPSKLHPKHFKAFGLVIWTLPFPSYPQQKNLPICEMFYLKHQHFINVCKVYQLATRQISWIGTDLRLAAKAVLFPVEWALTWSSSCNPARLSQERCSQTLSYSSSANKKM